MAALTFYADESGPDSDSEFAVVGGLLLHPRDFFWLDVKWKEALARHAITLPIHMREFGAHGAFRGLSRDELKSLLTDLVAIINEHKHASLAATLVTEQYRRIFHGIAKLSMYGACFT